MNDQLRILSTFVNEQEEAISAPFDLPANLDTETLTQLCNTLLKNEEQVPYKFFIDGREIRETLQKEIEQEKYETEKLLKIYYQPQAVFKVHSITRCTSSLPGHAEAVISVAFSPDAKYLASGSGDSTIRFWDLNTETPQYTCKGHTHWVLAMAWSPDGRKLASGCKSGQVLIWDPLNGKQLGKTLSGHKQWITCLVWEPFHQNEDCRRLASASKDCSIRIWDTVMCKSSLVLSGHLQSVTCIRWGGEGLIYSASQDRTIKVWRDIDGVLCRTLSGHGHWVNTLALSTDYVLRTGSHEPAVQKDTLSNKMTALARYKQAKGNKSEYMVSGSDDHTLFLWQPSESKKEIARLTGHQALINDVKFSPDGSIFASASFDKSIKLWHGTTGKFIGSLRGHVGSVYQISWSADSRLICSGSADSTLKVWDVSKKKLLSDLPGHANEVYAVDWSPDGLRVASGGKDKVIKIWKS